MTRSKARETARRLKKAVDHGEPERRERRCALTTAIVWSNPSRVDRHRAGRFVLVEANEAGEVRVDRRRDDTAVKIRGLTRVVDDCSDKSRRTKIERTLL